MGCASRPVCGVNCAVQPITPALVPTGLTVASLGPRYDAARWDEPLRAAHNAACADHWGSAPVSQQAWVHWRTGNRSFRPGCSAVATTADGEIAGYVLGYEYDADTERTGRRDLYVATVAPSPPIGDEEWRLRYWRTCCTRPVASVTTPRRSPSTPRIRPVPWASTRGRAFACAAAIPPSPPLLTPLTHPHPLTGAGRGSPEIHGCYFSRSVVRRGVTSASLVPRGAGLLSGQRRRLVGLAV
jgi:hypothetical protein